MLRLFLLKKIPTFRRSEVQKNYICWSTFPREFFYFEWVLVSKKKCQKQNGGGFILLARCDISRPPGVGKYWPGVGKYREIHKNIAARFLKKRLKSVRYKQNRGLISSAYKPHPSRVLSMVQNIIIYLVLQHFVRIKWAEHTDNGMDLGLVV